MSGVAKAKLLLFGEHAAVYGYPAVGLSLPWQLKVTLTPHGAEILPLSQLVPGLRGTIDSQIPIGAGFGSSAALCIACLGAVNAHLRRDMSLLQMWEMAHELEKRYHGTPSGIDTGLSLYDQPSFFCRKGEGLPEIHPLSCPPLPLVIGSIPRKMSTCELVKKVQATPGKEFHLQALGNIAEQSVEEIKNFIKLGQLAQKAQGHLAALGLSTPELDAILSYGTQLGAYGGKLSGAGGGGAYYFLTQDPIKFAETLSSFVLSHNIQHIVPPTPIPTERLSLTP